MSNEFNILKDNYFNDKHTGFYIECGASNGKGASIALPFEKNCGWKGINIEPSPILYKQLLKNRPNSFLNINIALSSTNGKMDLYDIPTGNSSFDPMPQMIKLCKTYDRHYNNKVTVNVLTYDTLMEKESIANVDLLALDVEGHELEVLKGMSNKNTLPKVLCVEYPHVSLRLDNGFDEFRDIIINKGYVFDFISQNNAYFSINGLFPRRDSWIGETNTLWEWDDVNVKWIY